MYFPTTAKLEATDYPYGRLRTSMFFSVEYNPKRGYRSVRQTINPKTGRLNKPKKSTYVNGVMLVKQDDKGHYGFASLRWDTCPEKLIPFLSKHWELFTPEQQEDIYLSLITQVKVRVVGLIQWRGAKQDDAIGLYDLCLKALVDAAKTPTVNSLDKITFPTEIEEDAICPKDFSPFTVTHHKF